MPGMEKRESYIELADKISNIDVCIAKGFALSMAQHDAVTSSIADLKRDQEKLLHILYGNGKEGLLTTIAKITQKLNLMWTLLSVLAMSMLALSTGIVQDFVSHFYH